MKGRVLVDPELVLHLGDQSSQDLEAFYGRRDATRTGLKIGLLASNPELYSNQRILEAGEERGHEMTFLNIKQCYMRLDATTPEVHYRGGKVINDLDAAITYAEMIPSAAFGTIEVRALMNYNPAG